MFEKFCYSLKRNKRETFDIAQPYGLTKLPASANTLMAIIHLTITVGQLENNMAIAVAIAVAVAIAIAIAHDYASIVSLVFMSVPATVLTSACVSVSALLLPFVLCFDLYLCLYRLYLYRVLLFN